MLIVEQNVVDGLSISDRGYVVENGEITLEGTPKELLGNSGTENPYLRARLGSTPGGAAQISAAEPDR